MTDLDLYWAEMKLQQDQEIAKNTRHLRLAAMNGIRPELVERTDLHWFSWWVVPAHWVPIAGAMMLAVDLT